MILAGPMLGMVFWTILTIFTIFIIRVTSVKKQKINAKYFKVFQGEAPDFILKGTRHFANLFEIPVLFYLACLFSFFLEANQQSLLICGWIYVGFRMIHTVIHLTRNHVLHRMLVFMASNLALFVIWVQLTLTWLKQTS